jgi:ATP-dependent RNA helicase DDX35
MADDLSLSTTFIPSLYKPAALLPIARHRDSLLYTIETFPVTIVVGQTGSGKTTQLPQYLDQAGWTGDGKIIGVTQVCQNITYLCDSPYNLTGSNNNSHAA